MSGTLQVLSPREASIFACFADAVVAPEPPLPPVRETDTVAYIDRWMAASPRINAIGLRVLLHAIELAPLASHHARLRQLDRDRRADWVKRVQGIPNPHVRLVWKLVKGAAQMAYYGDRGVMRTIGYDAEANLARGRDLRVREGRP